MRWIYKGSGLIAAIGLLAGFSNEGPEWQLCDPWEWHPIEEWTSRTETAYFDTNDHLIVLYSGNIYTSRWRDCTTDEWLW